MHERITVGISAIIPLDNYSILAELYPPDQYRKLASILLLKKIGLPILPGFVVTNLNEDTIRFLANWAKENGSKRLSLRFDSSRTSDHVQLSSLNPSLEELKIVAPLIRPPIIGLVLSENDRYKQGHSVLVQFLDDRLRCEVVGPGFDAGDITRGNVTPSETIEIVHKESFEFDGELSPIDILNHHIMAQDNYTKSREHRFGVIYSILDKGLGKSTESMSLNPDQQEKVNNFLLERGASIPPLYEPLGWDRLARFYSYIKPLDSFREYYRDNFGIDVDNKVLSSSFLQKYGLIFWDFYDGKKYRLR